MNDAGLLCVAAFLAPREEVRQKAAEVVGRDRFFVVHLNAPIDICRARDQEGLYAAADKGEIANFPGVSANYEEPAQADLVLGTHELDVDECINRIMQLLEERDVVKA